MASLIEKLGSTISSKVSSSISGFGAGAKSAFISANPALFGPAANLIENQFKKISSTQEKSDRKSEEREKSRQGFFEESDREQKKYQNDMLGSIDGIEKNKGESVDVIEQILDAIKKCFL